MQSHLTKQCRGCKQTLPLDRFGTITPNKSRGYLKRSLHSRCRECVNAQNRAYYAKDDTPWWKSNLKVKYGLTAEQYESMHAAQGGRCAICGATESVTRHRQKRTSTRLSVDHSHTPGGKIRGLLCNRCNRAIGLFEDSPSLLEAAIRYLTKDR